jgi:hypothetical protein
MEISKKEKVIKAVKAENWKVALSIAKNFTREFNKNEQRTLQIAAECMSGHTQFYSQMGIDTISEVEKSKKILIQYSK